MSVRIGLAARVALSHIALVIVALTVFAVSLTTVVERSALQAGVTADRITARRLAPWIEAALEQTGTWRGVERLLSSGFGPGAGRLEPMMQTPMPMGPRGRIERPPLPEQAVAILSASGEIVAQTRLPAAGRRALGETSPDRGVAIHGPAGETAYLFVGSMISSEVNPLRDTIVAALMRAATLAALAVAGASVAISIVWSRWLLRPIRALEEASTVLGTGDYRARVAVPRGTHELASLSLRFNAMAGEIERQEATRRRFVADAAHELRTPVALLRARVDMLRDGVYQPGADQWDAFANDLDRMAHLVSDLQMLARLEAEIEPTERAPVAVHELFAATASRFAPVAAERGIVIVSDAAASITVTVDRSRIERAIDNLAGNALRYGDRDSTLYLEATVRGDQVDISVEDAGPGIPPAERERVRERFVRLDAGRSRDHGGSGLGLAIVAEIVRAHSGSLTITDAIHTARGTRCTISLPADIGRLEREPLR